MHTVMADGLCPAMDYCHTAVSSNTVGQVRSRQGVFRTAPLKGAPMSFVVTSETGGNGSPARVINALEEAIAAERPDFLQFVGDMVADGNRTRDWDEYLFTPFQRLISHTPFYHCAG